jgi:hypothetical protein
MRRLAIGFVLIGSTVFSQSFQTPPLVLTDSRPTADAAFGSALAIGDFNADGIQDLAVSTFNERVLIFYGRATLQRTPNRALTAREAGIGFGAALAAGDWNRDGRTDLAIGAPDASNSEDPPSMFDGKVIVYRGASNFGTNPMTLRSPIPPLPVDPDVPDFGTMGGHFGEALAAGDVDGDRTSDLIVSASWLDAVAILYGGTQIGSRRTILQNIAGEFLELYFAVAAGDVNKDGFADVLIGAPFGGPNRNGAVYVFFGGRSLSSRPNLTLPNPRPASDPDVRDSTFASSLAAADLNGDGYADIIVGDPSQSYPRVYVYLGGPTVSTTPALILQESVPRTGSYFGYALAAGDLNGDGIADLAVGAPAISEDSEEGQRAGQVHVFYGGSAIGPTANLVIDPPSPVAGMEFGTALAIGDLNRDGKPDLVVGAPGAARRAGQVIVYLGR